MSTASDKDLAALLSSQNTAGTKKDSSWVGLALVGITGGAAVVLSVIAAPFVAPALRKVCLPFVPASDAQVRNVVAAVKTLRTKSLVDLGSGDGRVVIAAVQEQMQRHCKNPDLIRYESPLHGTGVELNPWLLLWSRVQAMRAGVSSRTTFLKADLFKVDLWEHDGVVIFGVQEMMESLEEKFEKELPSYGAVIACRFPLPNWKPTATIGHGIDTVWVYKREPHPMYQQANNQPQTEDAITWHTRARYMRTAAQASQ